MRASLLLDWASGVPLAESPEVRRERMRTAPDTWPLIAAECFWGQAAGWFCLATLHQTWIFGWLLLDLAMQVIRVRLKVACIRAESRSAAAPPYLGMLFASVAWIAVFTLGTTLFLVTGNGPMFGIIGIIATGGMGYAASRYAAFPRLGVLLLYLLLLPLITGAMSRPETTWFAFLAPGISVALHVMLLQNHAVLMKALLAEQENRRLSMHDPLTGLPNRVRLREHLTGLIAQAAQRGSSARFAVLCLDLDGFKPVNDRHGHSGGDQVLQGVAARLRSGLRAHDLVCRLGGDEFVVILADVGHDGAIETAERLITVCGAQPYDLDGGATATVGVSVGIAIAPQHGTDPDQLLICADNALYTSKRTTKGTWSVHGLPGPRRPSAVEAAASSG